ncbi:hypothetical protein HY994_00425 [Candidatus Micrarchaeota archaeon]|nr:hypothetical protein [Candidatus Micrarchaeota archaeon]
MEVLRPESTHQQTKHTLIFYPKPKHAQAFANIHPFVDAREPEYDYPTSVGVLDLHIDHASKKMTVPYLITNFIKKEGFPRGLLTHYGGFRYRLWKRVFELADKHGIERILFNLEMRPNGKLYGPQSLEAFKKVAKEHGYDLPDINMERIKKSGTGYAIATRRP